MQGYYRDIMKAMESEKPENVPVLADQPVTVLKVTRVCRESADMGREVEVYNQL